MWHGQEGQWAFSVYGGGVVDHQSVPWCPRAYVLPPSSLVPSVSEAVAHMEQSKSKCIGITIETRPDYCLKPHLNEMLSYGCTRIEIGKRPQHPGSPRIYPLQTDWPPRPLGDEAHATSSSWV